ncbi:MAG: hypothetical protein ACI9JK_001641 [Phycisphaerales bacterium]|jgi:hypothetical protein
MSTKKTISVAVPANSAWPLVAALGTTLTFAGFLTSWPVGATGGIIALVGFVGWFKNCYPHDVEVELEVQPHHVPSEISSARTTNTSHPHHRAKLPIEVHRVPSGIIGGIAGGVAMLLFAIAGSLIIHGSPWYPFNVAAATLLPSITENDLLDFNGTAFLVALVIQLFVSVCIGLVYGAVLPMLPRRPILLASIIIPFIWTFLLYESMKFINPTLDSTVNWWWFLCAQLVFGTVAGIVVSKGEKIKTLQFKSFAERAGVEENQP